MGRQLVRAGNNTAVPSEQDIEARRRLWCQTPESKLAGPDDAARFIERAGVVTLFPASPEIPNLYHAFMGDPEAKTDSRHDSPSGEVYSWRWALGRREAAFYSILVAGRPTWIAWPVFPAVLRLCGEPRSPEELYENGELSADAFRIAEALEEAGGTLSTGELRARANFPTGKAQRAAYLKAVDELDRRLLLAKVFSADDDEMRHTLTRTRYPQMVERAASMAPDQAMDALLGVYLVQAVYVVPSVLAKHARLQRDDLDAGLRRAASAGQPAR
jgi:hypothetical protein